MTDNPVTREDSDGPHDPQGVKKSLSYGYMPNAEETAITLPSEEESQRSVRPVFDNETGNNVAPMSSSLAPNFSHESSHDSSLGESASQNSNSELSQQREDDDHDNAQSHTHLAQLVQETATKGEEQASVGEMSQSSLQSQSVFSAQVDLPEQKNSSMQENRSENEREASAGNSGQTAPSHVELQQSRPDATLSSQGESGEMPSSKEHTAVLDGPQKMPAKEKKVDKKSSFWRVFWGILYIPLGVIVDFLAVALLQTGLGARLAKFELSSAFESVRDFVNTLLIDHNLVLVLNMILVGMIYIILLAIINRFWITSAILLTIAAFLALAEHFKIAVRYEAILPSDLNFVKSDAANVASFLSTGAKKTMLFVGLAALVMIIVAVMIHVVDPRHGRVIAPASKLLGIGIRFVSVLVCSAFLVLFTLGVSNTQSWASKMATAFGDTPKLWDSVFDAKTNGPLMTFLRSVKPKIMDKPEQYSEETMRAIAERYAQQADKINEMRSNRLEDNTVILILSESFANPQRVPGIKLNKDPMPYINQLKTTTDSGLMFSSGYGGGTANLEYMALTGMSMALFSPSLTVPYLQMVPNASWAPTFNRLWPDMAHNVAFHPYEPSLYSRLRNYKKFGFAHFYNQEGPDVIPYRGTIGRNPYISDADTYKSVLESAKSTTGNNFLQVVTMQNHAPYTNWYDNNPYTIVGQGAQNIPESERKIIQEYADGAHYTDEATKEFLKQLNELQKPVTVIFYGDHLPGIYDTAASNRDNIITLHLTDYFIWSNNATKRAATAPKTNQYSSPNFFMAETAEHLNAKVTPLLAFLTLLHQHVAAMEQAMGDTTQDKANHIPESQPVYLDSNGHRFNIDTADETTKQLINDYRLIQYDITAGKGYLKKWHFVTMQ